MNVKPNSVSTQRYMPVHKTAFDISAITIKRTTIRGVVLERAELRSAVWTLGVADAEGRKRWKFSTKRERTIVEQETGISSGSKTNNTHATGNIAKDCRIQHLFPVGVAGSCLFVKMQNHQDEIKPLFPVNTANAGQLSDSLADFS